MNDTSTAQSVVQAYCDAWLEGDAMAVVSLYHDDLELFWPGSHRLAGVYRGQSASIEALLELQGLTNRVPVKVLDILVGTHSIIATVIERWTDNSDDSEDTQSLDLQRALEYTVQDGKLRTCRVYETDQPAIDEWIQRCSQNKEGLM